MNIDLSIEWRKCFPQAVLSFVKRDKYSISVSSCFYGMRVDRLQIFHVFFRLESKKKLFNGFTVAERTCCDTAT